MRSIEKRIKQRMISGIPIWLLLAISCRKPMYPYGAFSIIERETDGFIKNEGKKYPLYDILKENEFVRVEHEEFKPPFIRRYYKATDLGVEALNHVRDVLFKMYDGADAVLASFGIDVTKNF